MGPHLLVRALHGAFQAWAVYADLRADSRGFEGAIFGDSYMGIGGIVFLAALAIVAEPVALRYLANVVTFAMDPDSCKDSIVYEQMREI